MALFGHKKRTEEIRTVPKAKVDPEDIWNMPVKKENG